MPETQHPLTSLCDRPHHIRMLIRAAEKQDDLRQIALLTVRDYERLVHWVEAQGWRVPDWD